MMSWVPALHFQDLCDFNVNCTTCPTQSVMFATLVSIFFGYSIDKKTFHKRPAEFDFIIVGAGSAGCVLANRLTEIENWTVLLLEAGIEELRINEVPGLTPLLFNSNIDWKYKSEPEENSCANKGCNIPRGKIMGGSSSMNGMLYVRGSGFDYDTWAKLGNKGWSYEEVLPYFKKSENNRNDDIVKANPQYHNTGGILSVETPQYRDKNAELLTKAWQELGYEYVDLNAKKQIGVMNLQTTTLNGERQSTNAAFIRPFREKRPNLFIETEAFVTKIKIDPKTKKAIGVEYTISGEKKIAMSRKEVVVSAGTVNSPKLLMLSGIGPAEELLKHNINLIHNLSVGRNLQDHASLQGFNINLGNKTSSLKNYKNMIEDLQEYLKTRKGPFTAMGPLTTATFIKSRFESENEVPDIQYNYVPVDSTGLAIISNSYDKIMILPIVLNPNSRGSVSLNATDPIWGDPVIRYGFFTEDPDREQMLEAIKMSFSLFKTKVFLDNEMKQDMRPWPLCEMWTFNTDDYWYCMMKMYTKSLYRLAGTCKMGPFTDPEAVVDPRLRVYGIKGLRVVDASIMPKIVRGSTSAPIIMIAEKASDMIKDDWTTM